MCNRGLACFVESCEQFEGLPDSVDRRISQHQPLRLMDSLSSVAEPDSGSDTPPGSNDGMPRAKFLCSFGGRILPRPQDGKLRYVGGETRIVCFTREISYEEFMGKMRELYEGVVVIKYQQPDEDLDALVSVVNDDDVMNMMEEYDKLGSGEGLSRLRIFLFSQLDQDFPTHYIDGDERESERRYVDALNNTSDPAEFWRFQPNESAIMRGIDEFHLADQLYNPYDVNLHNQRNGDMTFLPYGLRHVAVPRVSSGQFLQHGSQRLSEIDVPWSPGYCSPQSHGFHDPRSEFPSSPASARFGMPFGEAPDNGPDQAAEESVRSRLNHQLTNENLGQAQDNGLGHHGDKPCLPCNASHNATNFSDGNTGCEHCQIPMPRNQSQFELGSMGGGLPPCNDCRMNANMKVHPIVYPRGQVDPHGHNDGWVLQQLGAPMDDLRANPPGAVRMSDHYLIDASSSNFPFGHSNLADGHHPLYSHVHHRHGPDFGGDVLHEHPFTAHGHIPFTDDRYIRYRNMAHVYGPENPHQISHAPNGHAQPMWRNIQNPGHGSPPYEASSTPKLMNGVTSPGVIADTPEGSPRFGGHPEPSNNVMATIGNSFAESVLDQNAHDVENQQPINLELIHSTRPPCHDSLATRENGTLGNGTKGNAEIAIAQDSKKVLLSLPEEFDPKTTHVNGNACPPNSTGNLPDILLDGQETHLPNKNTEINVSPNDTEINLIESTQRVALEGGSEEGIAKADGPDMGVPELDSNGDSNLKIEPTKAEEEAKAQGLQTIKNEDLEEIRVLGSGTYGAVYHGKWKGSDVAIKRIKASCFAGRPSERERLISDFWREASILGSLHHPNVVSFYGIVRDGPDGSLATVTEFMVNGSLKQFLQKKDRTIDRRKRLILAMDSAFGMEYLHGKNIVHFDLKCENLLVNMRDPQRPVCKIGDLGLSKVKQHTLVSGGVRGTLPWMAPELLSGKTSMVSEKIDVYSFGIVMWELLTGDEPYADMHFASIIGGIVNDSLRPQIPTWCDPEWRSLMESCWASDPAERPSFSEISQKLRSMAAAMNVK
ncbi:hypothetical protein MLD38_006729 [Melastoma candidum]|uniref:Uncharacterized protein n=1 Tax=Melastoma candidum TaxID=119954 RepID=A0ACB9RQ21_9MYRT|nr:hypothetical protein MLD38_006729 [Melastoma candidum]